MDTVTAKAQKYSSPTKYLMMVDTSKHRVYAFTGSKNNWKKIKTFVCTNGKASTPTKKGVFHIGTTAGKYKRAIYFTENNIRCWYATRIVNGILFHSVLYTISSKPTTIADGRLGVAASHGCVRLALANAKWIYTTVPNNTTVVIY
jgi:lipoprotein-anchoring transpeptidase ErfK/SrfK